MALHLPGDALVMLVGASGSGKSTWAGRHFSATQVVSSDLCRALVSDDEADQTVNREAFAVFYTILRQRLALGRLTVADSTGLQPFSRERMRGIAALHGRPVHAVVFAAPLERLVEHNRSRERRVPEAVLRRHAETVEEVIRSGALHREGYAGIHLVGAAEHRAALERVTPPAATSAGSGAASTQTGRS